MARRACNRIPRPFTGCAPSSCAHLILPRSASDVGAPFLHSQGRGRVSSNGDDNVIFRDESGNATDAQLLAFEDS
jgi:hypothetical protein